MPEPIETRNSSALLASTVEIGRNALWNYVSLIVWLRWLRRFRIAFNAFPIAFASVGSWRLLTDSTQLRLPLVAAAFAFVAGLLPLLYLASGIEDSISLAARLAGRYRVLEARVRDYVRRYHLFSSDEAVVRHERLFEDYLELKKEAQTGPRWAFWAAERLIAKKEYVPISLSDASTPLDEQGATGAS